VFDSDYEIAKARERAVQEARGQRLLRTMKAEIEKCAGEVAYLANEKDDIPPHNSKSLWEGFCHQVARGPEDLKSHEETVRAICGQVLSPFPSKSSESLCEWVKRAIYGRVLRAARTETKTELPSCDLTPEGSRYIERELLRAVNAEIEEFAGEVVYIAGRKEDIPPHDSKSLWDAFCHPACTWSCCS